MTVKRSIPFGISEESQEASIQELQSWLPHMIAQALRLKQAHWNLRGEHFKSIHEQLDEILEDVRTGVDDVAERIVTLGGAADGLPETVAKVDAFTDFPTGRLSVEQAVDSICDDLAVGVRRGRKAISHLGEVDPVSEDLAIGVVGALEKHHWMLQSQKDL